jgi:hypothetical protein
MWPEGHSRAAVAAPPACLHHAAIASVLRRCGAGTAPHRRRAWVAELGDPGAGARTPHAPGDAQTRASVVAWGEP